jgi:hypothetical protein
VDEGSKAIHRHLNGFSAGLALFSDYFVANRAKPQRTVAISCMHEWLGHWATQDAMTTRDAKPTGVALRFWALFSIASAVLKLDTFADEEWALTTLSLR